MDEVIKLKAKSEAEVQEMIKNILHLKDNEAVEIKVLKSPKKILFLNIEGLYEIKVVDKNKLKEIERQKQQLEKEKALKAAKEKEKKTEPVVTAEKKPVTKAEPVKTTKEVYVPKETNTEYSKKEEDNNENKIRAAVKEFIVNSKLNVNIKNIQYRNGRYIVNLDGKDIRYLIGEKGTTLNSLEYLLGTILKNIKVTIDSNGYKNKREESLRILARKKGEKVMETGSSIKLNPMSARERKIIHEEISFMKELETQSVGEEPKRCLIIKKKR